MLLNVLAHELEKASVRLHARPAGDLRRGRRACTGACKGAYAVVAMIAGYGLLAFRDPFGIRPLVHRRQRDRRRAPNTWSRRESVALDALGFRVLRDVAPGEAVFIDQDGQLPQRSSARRTRA